MAFSLLNKSNIVSSSGGAGTDAVTIPSTSAGSLLFMIVSTAGGGSSTAVSDATNGAWTFAAAPRDDAGEFGSRTYGFFYFVGSAAGVTTVTITNAAFDDVVVCYGEYSGVATSSALDQSTDFGTWAASGTYTSPTINTANANDLLIGLIYDESATETLTGANGFTVQQSDNAAHGHTIGWMDKVVSATGSYAASGTFSPTGGAAVAIFAFKASGAAAPAPIFVPQLLTLGVG